MKQLMKTTILGLLGVAMGLLASLLFRAQQPLPVSVEYSREKPHSNTRLDDNRTKVDRKRADRPDDWHWKPGRNYTTLAGSGRVGRDVLKIAGLEDKEAARVKRVFEQAFQRVERDLATRFRKMDEMADKANGIECFELKGDPKVFEETMRALREDLIAEFGNGAAKVLYEGFRPHSKYEGMGQRDLIVKKRSRVLVADNFKGGRYDGNLYGKREGDVDVSFNVQFYDHVTHQWKDASGFQNDTARDYFGNLVDLFK